jgi:hypothetical protein
VDRKTRNPATPEQHRICANHLFAMTSELSTGQLSAEVVQRHFRKNSEVMKHRQNILNELLRLRALLESDLTYGGHDTHHVYFQGGCESNGCHHDERQAR